MNWKDYEKEVYEIFKSEYPEADISFNCLRAGRYSKTDRQCDVLIEDYIAGIRMTIVVDAKLFNKKVDVKDVDSFVGMLEDIGAHKGLLITQVGYSEAALNRAAHGSSDIELDILNFAQLQRLQSHAAIPFSGKYGVLIPAPFGWIIDGSRSSAWLAVMYQQGRSLDASIKAREYMYVNFWNRRQNGHSLEDLLEIQATDLIEHDPNTKIEPVQTIRRSDAKTALRMALVPRYGGTIEYTGYVEFDDFIFFCVLHTPENVKKRNIRKLENVMSRALRVHINNNTTLKPDIPDESHSQREP